MIVFHYYFLYICKKKFFMEKEYKGKKYKFFWGGIFSNWYVADFVIDGITYNCGEQYMMYQKAMFFNDIKTADEILEEIVPSEQKALGRQVKNYNDSKWSKVRYDIVKKGLKEKFTQNSSAKKMLLKYKGYQFVEASPKDRIWGIGFDSYVALDNIDNWGENLLGKILTELAQEIN